MKKLFLILACAAVAAGCVKNDPVEALGISLDKESITLLVGDSQTLVATIEKGDVPDVEEKWSSNNGQVAKVYGGVVVAVGEGSATITAKAGNKIAKCLVTVVTITDSGIEGNLNWTLTSNGVLTISGNGAMSEFHNGFNAGPPWEIHRENIKEIIIDDGVKNIGRFAFNKCTALTKVTIPNSVMKIGEGAFGGCSSIKNIIIPGGVLEIGPSAFYGCISLKEITIPSSVTKIISFIFVNCVSLKSIEVEQGNQNYASENGVLFDKGKTKLLEYPLGGSDIYVVPDEVTQIEEAAFVFNNRIKEITIPGSVTRIGHSAFYDCPKLEKVTIMATTPPYLASSTSDFKAATDDTLYVPVGCVDVYKANTAWNKAFANIVEQSN